jgi:hypothetical protein
VTPPIWLIVLTAAFTVVILMMAVAETTLWTHYLIDQGEYVSLAGLAFILAAGVCLHRRQRLRVSLPLAIPWLIYPVVTQGDQIIDNLTINEMRFVVHFILGILFAAPVTVLVVAARERFRSGVVRNLALLLVLIEIWVAYRYLGVLMIVTLVVMSFGLLLYLSRMRDRNAPAVSWERANGFALKLLVTGVALSLMLFLGFKNRAGVYQGSPHFYHDPSENGGMYAIDETAVPQADLELPQSPQLAREMQSILAMYGEALKGLHRGYYILDRNYNYAFHNALFLRNTPLLPNFRTRGLQEIEKARDIALQADVRLDWARASSNSFPAVCALMNEAQAYVAYNLKRAAMLEEMTARFEQTEAGLQHATHVYEGEGKILGIVAGKILDKHRAALSTPKISALAHSFVVSAEEVHQGYSNRIVGF